MAKAAVFSARLAERSADAMRAVAVAGCALALIAAGQILPF